MQIPLVEALPDIVVKSKKLNRIELALALVAGIALGLLIDTNL